MTKQVKNFNKTRLPIGTLTNFHKKVLTLIGTTTAAALHVEGLEPPYTAAVETLSSIVNRPTTYVATQSRQDVDDRRDRFVGVIHQIINAHKTNPIAEKKAASNTLDALMAPYRSIARHQYAKETEARSPGTNTPRRPRRSTGCWPYSRQTRRRRPCWT